MQVLNFPNAESFVQSLRQRRNAAGGSVPFIVVEGSSDRKALFPFIDKSAVIIPASGKGNLIYAYRRLEKKYRRQTVFLLDCDGATNASLKGKPELVLTSNRDIEADIIFELSALTRMGQELLAEDADRSEDVDLECEALKDSAINFALNLGIVRAAARDQKLKTHLRTHRTGRSRKIGLPDIECAAENAKQKRPSDLSLGLIVRDMASIAEWSKAESEAVRKASEECLSRKCSRHTRSRCKACLAMRYCNGHDLVEALHMILDLRYSVILRSGDVDRYLRISADRQKLPDWTVFSRLEAWENLTGAKLLA